MKKQHVFAAAIIAGLIGGKALAADPAATAAPTDGAAAVEKTEKSKCKGHKNKCKGGDMKKHKNKCKGKNGCGEKKEEPKK